MMLSRQRLTLRCPGPPVVIGRDLSCDVVLNDPFVAARHAALSLRPDGSVAIEDLGTVNGLIRGDERVRQAMIAGTRPTEVQVGHTLLRVRADFGPLAPERPDRESLRSRHREYAAGGVGALLAAGFAVLLAWLTAPDDPVDALVGYLLGGAAALAAWFAFWVLLGRAVRSRWIWTGNAAITLATAAGAAWSWWGGEVATFVTGAPRLGLLGTGVALLAVVIAVYLHLRTATRLRRGPATALAIALPVLAGAGVAWYDHQQHAADVNRIDPPGRLFPPDWSRQPGVRLDRFLEDSLDLRDIADQRRTE